MSLNSLPIDTAQCDYYDGISNVTSSSRINNCSSMRVQFRMVTHKNATIRNANFMTSSVSQQNISPSTYETSSIPFTRNYVHDSPGMSSTTSHQHHHFQGKQHHQRMQFTETNIQEKTVCYDTYTEAIPINIGTAPVPTTKTFQLTEDLKSNIKLDITLSPSMSLRDNRLDPSRANSIRSAQLNMNCVKSSESSTIPHSDFYERKRQEFLQNEMKLARQSRGSRDMSSRYYQTMPDTHSSLIRLTFSGRSGSSKKILINGCCAEPAVAANSYSRNQSSPPPVTQGSTHSDSRMASPFTYIETSSSRRKMSMSPSCANELHKAWDNCFTFIELYEPLRKRPPHPPFYLYHSI